MKRPDQPHGLNEAPPRRTGRWPIVGMGAVLLLALVLRLRDVGHPSLILYDESFHAIVAQNLLKHPLRPTLLEHPWLAYDALDWRQNHIWLHKGTVPLWQIAASFMVLGVSTFALRLPSVLLSTAGVGLTFLIGRRLLGPAVALIAAFLQAINPSFLKQVHGFWFSDHVDVALLFWQELALYFMVRAMLRSGRRDWLLAGLAQGAAFLCKSHVGLLPIAVGLALWIAHRAGFGREAPWRIRAVDLLWMMLATVITIAPWNLWCWLQYPAEFRHELLLVGRHLDTDIEGWAAPWDRLHFDYSILMYTSLYAPIIVATMLMVLRCVMRRDLGLALPLIWGLIVQVVFTLATTKTPAATIIAMPAFFLIFGVFVSRAASGDWTLLSAWAGVTLAGLLDPVAPRSGGQGYPDPPLAGVLMKGELWVFGHVLCGLGAAGLAALVKTLLRPRAVGARGPGIALAAAGMCGLGTMALALPMLREGWVMGRPKPTEATYTEIAGMVKTKLPPSAALMVEERIPGESRTLAFYCDRTAYLCPADPREMGRKIRAAGGAPYILTGRKREGPALMVSRRDKWLIYECP